jgi:hypothetical protein
MIESIAAVGKHCAHSPPHKVIVDSLVSLRRRSEKAGWLCGVDQFHELIHDGHR